MKTSPVGAVQMASQDGQIRANLERALLLVEKAANAGAQIILLPELMPTGYACNAEMWESGEPCHGPTVQWLKKHAERLGAYLGTNFLEADREDFFNTFILTTHSGAEAGRVRKQTRAAKRPSLILRQAAGDPNDYGQQMRPLEQHDPRPGLSVTPNQLSRPFEHSRL